jgi:putative ABC transport system ATP-binding protein
MNIIETQDLTKHYKQGQKVITAADAITLTVKKGEFLAIVGPSGSGKSTLLQLLGGLERPTSGKIIVDGVDLAHAPEKQIVALRRNSIGFIFQSFNLISTLTAAQNVEAAIGKRSPNDIWKAQKALALVGLAHRSNHLPSALSGGEQQRVAIARATINNPQVILADEPTGNLDSKTAEEIMQLLHSLNKERHKTIVLITHSDHAKQLTDRILEIRDGCLVREQELGRRSAE